MTLEETKDYLSSLPGVIALYWFMENINEDHPHRTELFFYCRERVGRYWIDTKAELKWDKQMFDRLNRI